MLTFDLLILFFLGSFCLSNQTRSVVSRHAKFGAFAACVLLADAESIVAAAVSSVVVLVLVFDVTERESFAELASHIDRLKPHFIVANKTDLAPKRAVSEEEGSNLAKSVAEEKCQYFEVRADFWQIKTVFLLNVCFL